MKLSSCGTAVIVNVLSIFFFITFFFCGVDAKEDPLLPRCPILSGSAATWWDPLRYGDERLDPCQLFKSIRDRDSYAVGCCFDDPAKDLSRRGDDHDDHDDHGDKDAKCGPCNVQTYNLASACKACEGFPNSLVPPDSDVMVAAKEFPSFSLWTVNEDSSRGHVFEHLPTWVNVSTTPAGGFDIRQILQAANTKAPVVGTFPPSTVNSASSSDDDVDSSRDDGSSRKSSDSPSGYMKQSPTSFAKLHAGAIAGGVIGGLVFTAIVVLGMIYFLRSRRRRRGAPSSEFVPVAGEGSPGTKGLEEPSRPYPASWRPFPSEKWPTTATGASKHGLMSNSSPLGRDIEK